jgi:hypothetical protein
MSLTGRGVRFRPPRHVPIYHGGGGGHLSLWVLLAVLVAILLISWLVRNRPW